MSASGPFANPVIDRDGSTPAIMQGAAANRPAAGYVPNDWYLATDTQILYRWDGPTLAWVAELSNGGTGGVPTLQNVLDNGNTATDTIILTLQPYTFNISGRLGKLFATNITANRNWQLPDNSGTIALVSDIPGVPTLDQVTTAGNTSFSDIILENSLLEFVSPVLWVGQLIGGQATGNQTWTLPDKTGTIALLSDIPGAANLQAVTTAGNTTTNNISLLQSFIQYTNAGGSVGALIGTAMTAARQWALPDASGTVSLVDYVIKNIAGTTYVPVISDDGPYIISTNAATQTVTIPTNASVAFNIGAVLTFQQGGAGKVTFTPAGGVTITSKAGNLSTNGQNVVVQLIKTATNTWNLFGDLTV